MKKSIRSKINRIIAVSVIFIAVIFTGISMVVVHSFTTTSAETIMADTLEAQTIKLNSEQISIEQAVSSIYEVSKHALEDYSNLRSEEDIDAYLDLLRSTAVSIAKNTSGGAAVYFRLSPEIAGDGKQGFLYVKDNRSEKFYRSENTDILAYDENDDEHVGWYYKPLKEKKGVWLSPYYNANLDFNVISYVMPIYDGNIPVGVVGMDVDFNKMIKLAENVDAFESCSGNLVDLDLKTVYYNRCDLLGKTLDDSKGDIAEKLSREKRTYRLVPFSLNNEDYSMHFSTLENGMKYVIYVNNADIFGIEKTIILVGIVIFAIIFIITILVAFRLSNKITEPIQRINEATKEYAKGNWDVSLTCDTGDELKELTDNILDMASRTKRSIEELGDALSMAQKAGRAKSTFLSNMSHDIRTPMNAILSYTNFAIEQPELSEKTHSYLEQILKAGKHLLSLINSVLEMSRIESGKMQLNTAPCNIKALIEDIETLVYANITEKNQNLTIDTTKIKNSFVICDRLKFNQVLINLVGNAIKFTDDGGGIFITASEEDINNPKRARYHFSVRDTGIGVDEDFIDNIFTPFERENNAVDQIQGTGLGLAISKNIVEMMGGNISVKSKKGEGTEFFIDVEFDLADEKVSGELQQEEEEDLKNTVDLSGLKILLAEDNKVNRLIVREILGKKVAVLDEAENGKEAVDWLKEKGPGYYSLVLMDIQMPVMNGYEATKEIRGMKDKELSQIPIIAMTANAFEEDRRNSLNAGMNAHVTKPIDINVLIKTIASMKK